MLAETCFTPDRFAPIHERMTPNDRLRKARLAAGYQSASQAAKALGVAVSTYIAHENGQNTFGTARAERYGAVFSVSSAWLLTGEGRGPDRPAGGDTDAEDLLAALPGIEDPKSFLKAYDIARAAEQDALGGRGDKEAFAAVVNQIYRLIRSGRTDSPQARG